MKNIPPNPLKKQFYLLWCLDLILLYPTLGMIKVVRVLILLALLALAFPRQVYGLSGLVTYSTWKARKVNEAQSLVNEAQAEVKKLKILKELEALKSSELRLQQAKENLEVSKDLTAHDYWVLYAYPHHSTDRQNLEQAAKSLKPGDVVDILEGYSRRMKMDDLPTNDDSEEAN